MGLNKLLSCSFVDFQEILCPNDVIVETVFYIGKVRTDGTQKSQKLFNEQRKLLAHLKKSKVRYSLGYLLKTEGKFHEKGVDVNIAVDILVATYEDKCDKIFLVSSDTDLLPAVKKANEKGKLTEYVGFSHKPSLAMIANCSHSRLLTKSDVEKFIK